MDDAADVELPRGIALAWGVAANPVRGPKRELSIERIIDAAIAIADESGLAAVSMASIATALGYTTMSLYRYVSAKDDLILLMQEAGLGVPPLTVAEADGWREGLTRWYRASVAAYAEHPWILDIPITTVPSTPNNLTWLDTALEVLDGTPLDARSRVSAVMVLSGQSRWEATIARGYATEHLSRSAEATLTNLVTPEQFPNLAPVIAQGDFFDGEGNPFEFGVSRFLDGLEELMRQATSSGQVPSVVPPVALPTAVTKDDRVKNARQSVKDAEGRLRDARQKERDAIAKALERESRRA
jgi:AcrR family transcriptional regulator